MARGGGHPLTVMLRRLGWIVAGLVVLSWRAGWGSFPDSQWLATEIVPALPSLPRIDPLAQYSLYSPIGSFLAAIVGAHTETAFDVVHVVVMIAFAGAVGVLVVRRAGWTAAGLVGATFVGSQTGVVLLSWIGSYDVFTVGLTSLLVVTRDRRLAAALGFVVAFAGFEQGAFVLVALFVLALVGVGVGDGSRNRLVWAGVGLLLGRVALGVWLRANDVTHGRDWFLRQFGVGHFLEQFVHGLPWLLVSGLGAALLTVVVAVVHLPTRRARIVTVVVLLVALVPVALSLDQTRVLAVLTWPVLMALALDHARRDTSVSVRRLSMGTLGLAALVPGIVVWEGRAQLSTHSAWRWLVR